MRKLLCALLLCLPLHASAATVGDVKLQDKITIDKKELVLNGAGMRTKVIFKVYVGALYLPQKISTSEGIFADKGPKRVELHMVRHVNAGDFMEAFNKAINANHTPEEYAPIAARLLHFGSVFREVGEVDKGAIIILDYIPESGLTILTVNGKEMTRIPGQDFYNALLKIWIGNKPVQESLKKEMLGG
jgi:hypothetical protein